MLKGVVEDEGGHPYSLQLEPTLKLDWAEPGDPPLTPLAPKGQKPVSPHLRAKSPPGKRKAYPSRLPRWIEVELVRTWRKDFDESWLIKRARG